MENAVKEIVYQQEMFALWEINEIASKEDS